MEAGDHLVSNRVGYTHHGIYIGNGLVIHYAGFADGIQQKDEIRISPLEEFENGNKAYVKSYLFRTYNHDEAVNRAFDRLGEDWYNVLINNCEHFATWCVMGTHSSKQVNDLIAAAAQTKAMLSMSGLSPVMGGAVVKGLAGRAVVSSALGTSNSLLGVSTVASASTLLGTGLVATALPVVAVGYGVKKIWDFFND